MFTYCVTHHYQKVIAEEIMIWCIMVLNVFLTIDIVVKIAQFLPISLLLAAVLTPYKFTDTVQVHCKRFDKISSLQ